MKAAVVFMEGFEEGEALTIVDVLRRGNVDTDIVSDRLEVTGGHQIVVKSDVLLKDMKAYDLIALPGGYGGVDCMKESDILLNILKEMNHEGKIVAAMCAAPEVLDKAGLLNGKNYTAYHGYDQKIQSGNYIKQNVVKDGNIITGYAPASCYQFAYALLEALGKDSKAVSQRMIYHHSFKEVL